MTDADRVLIILLAASLLAVLYTYAAYPGLIWVLSRLFGHPPRRPVVADEELPFVSLVIAAHNEEVEIGSRIADALRSRYPAERFEVVIASDGSDDRTNDIVRSFDDPRVRLLAFAKRRGKSAVLNEAIPQSRGDVVMLSDANTRTDPAAMRYLAAWFADPTVCAVCGKLVLRDPVCGRNVDGLYWRYETFLKLCESRLGALLGSNGAIYAIRKPAFVPLPPHTLVDDFVLPLLAKANGGGRIVYDLSAVAMEETPADLATEFRRRARIGAGGFQSIGLLRGLLHPGCGWVALTFFSHKVIRWLCPFLLIIALVTNVALIGVPGFRELFLAQCTFYFLAAVATCLPARPLVLRAARLPWMFVLMNAALFVGFWRWFGGLNSGVWQRTSRSAERPIPAAELSMPLGAAARFSGGE